MEPFYGAQKQLQISFRDSNIIYFDKAVFKSFLDNKQNIIDFFEDISLIYCENYWLIKEKKHKQVK